MATALTGLTTTGTKVSTSMIHAYHPDNLPALSVLVARDGEEEVRGEVMGPAGWRTLAVVVEARACAVSGVEDTLDKMCTEVEVAMTAAAGVKALTRAVALSSTEITLDGDGEKPIGVARMVWEITYGTSGANPTSAG